VTRITVRPTEPRDFPAITALSERVYPAEVPWTASFLVSHREVFPEGQLVAEDLDTGEVVGMAATLIVNWDDYDRLDSYRDMTDGMRFTNHDPSGRTLYGAEVMVDPSRRRQGVGARIYDARRELAERLGLLRIRAGARLAGYGKHAGEMTAEEYVVRVVRGELRDPTLSFQLAQGFHVLAVVPGYLRGDRQSQGYAALIEWLNPAVATPGDHARRNPRFVAPGSSVSRTRG
jgi:GNAT superfamily N-acetyltransferase